MSGLLDPPRPQVLLIRAGQGAGVGSATSRYRATLLAAAAPGVRRDLFRITAEPGRPRDSDPHPHGIVEHVLLAAGRAMVGPADDPAELHPGDYICYPGDRPHVFEALEPGTWGMLASDYI